MKKSLVVVPVPAGFSKGKARKSKKPIEPWLVSVDKLSAQREPDFHGRESEKIHSQFAAYIAFVAAVFSSMIAAAAVISHEFPLLSGGF